MGFALFSGAWFADDALRLWRISLNWIRYGSPDFNHGARVLGIEQPLWVTLLTAGFALGGRAVTTVVVLQFLFFFAGCAILWACHCLTIRPGEPTSVPARSAAKFVFVAALLAASNSFREFMAAGLEYPLCLFLVALLSFAIARREAGSAGRDGAIIATTVFTASLLALARYALIWAIAPAAIVLGWRSRRMLVRHWRAAAVGTSPLILWMCFAIIRFGSIWPDRPENRALQSLPRRQIVEHGKLYLLSGMIQEPLTFFLLVLGAIAGICAFRSPRRALAPVLLSLGSLAYLCFVIWHGGDTVSGRMLCPAAILAAAALACAPAFPVRAYAFAACYGVIFFDLDKISLLRGPQSRVPRTTELFREWGIADDYVQNSSRPPAEQTLIESITARGWKAVPDAGDRQGPPLLSASPGRDGLETGPGREVQDWRGMGPLKPELSGITAMSVVFKAAEAGKIEPVLSIGEPASGTLFMAEHLPRGGLRFQIWTPGSVPIFSRAIPILDLSRPHRLVVSYGSGAAGRPYNGRFVVMLDGVLLADFQKEMRRYSLNEVIAGWNVENNPASAASFSGRIEHIGPAASPEIEKGVWPWNIARRNLVEVRVRFSKVTNSAEPIVVTGTDGMGDIVFVRRVGPGQIRFGQEHWGQAPELGPIIDVADDLEHSVQIALGPLFTKSCAVVRPDCVRLTMDGKVVFESRQVPYPFKSTEVSILDNPLAGSFCGRDFLGDIIGERTVSLEPLMQSVARVMRENKGPVSMTFRFDGSITGRGLGLLEVGAQGAGDIVYIIVKDRTHVRFYYDHWGYGGVTGSEVEIDPGKPHVLTVAMKSLGPPGDVNDDSAVTDEATLDGIVVLEGGLPSSSAKDGPIHLFDNAVHSSNVSAPYDGTCLSVARGGVSVSLSY
jgi:hypothetical protein